MTKLIFKFSLIICFIFVLIGLTNCNKNTYDETIVLLGKEAYVIPLNDLLPDTLKSKFQLHMGVMPEGYIPPNIEGEYVISPKEFTYSNFVNLFDNMDMYLRITKQHNRIATVEFYEGGTVVTDTAFIMGSGQLFTLYFKEEKGMTAYGYTSEIERCVVITGEKADQGIKNLVFGNIILEAKQGGNPFIGNFIPGWYFIYKDKDGLSENCNWFDNN